MIIVKFLVHESGNDGQENGFEGENLGVPRQSYHFIANVFHIGLIEAVTESAALECGPVIAHLVNDLVEHV